MGGSKWYFLDENGVMVTNSFKTINYL
ncbi:hypothetical protein [Caldifermentibacillus hisashii]